MEKLSEKNKAVEKYVDEFFIDNKRPPTYDEIAKQFNISKGTAHTRCKKFRAKIDKLRFAKTTQEQYMRVKIELLVPYAKVDVVNKMITKIVNFIA